MYSPPPNFQMSESQLKIAEHFYLFHDDIFQHIEMYMYQCFENRLHMRQNAPQWL